MQLFNEDQTQRTGLSNCQNLTGRWEKFDLRKMASCDQNALTCCMEMWFFLLLFFLVQTNSYSLNRKKKTTSMRRTPLTFSVFWSPSVIFTHGNERHFPFYFILNKRCHLSLFQIFSNKSVAIWKQSWSFVLVIIQSRCPNPSVFWK